jgi:hypothetical protein
MEDRAYTCMMVYGEGIGFFLVIMREIPCPKHHEIQEFAKNYHFSAMKIKTTQCFLILAHPCSTTIL